MIGDTSKHTTREKRRIGSVINRSIDVLPYEKGDNKDLTLTFKARNFNDRELTVKPDEYIDNVPFGYLPNIIKETGDGNLTSIPEKLFANNPLVTNFSYTFYSCSNLTGRGWETIITNAEQNAIDGGFTLSKTQCFRNCNALTDYGQIPAAWR